MPWIASYWLMWELPLAFKMSPIHRVHRALCEESRKQMTTTQNRTGGIVKFHFWPVQSCITTLKNGLVEVGVTSMQRFVAKFWTELPCMTKRTSFLSFQFKFQTEVSDWESQEQGVTWLKIHLVCPMSETMSQSRSCGAELGGMSTRQRVFM